MKKLLRPLITIIATLFLPSLCEAEIYSPSININGKTAIFWGKFYTRTLNESGTLYITSGADMIQISSGMPFTKLCIREVIYWDMLSETPVYMVDLGTQHASYSYNVYLDWHDDSPVQFTSQKFYAVQLYYRDDLIGLTFFTDYGITAGQFYYVYDTLTNSATVSDLNINVWPSDQHCEIPEEIELKSGMLSRKFNVTAIRSDINLSFFRYQSITIPKSVTEIGSNVFKGMKQLKEVTISDGEKVIALGYNTSDYDGTILSPFSDCPLEKVYMGRQFLSSSSISGMNLSAFADRKSLKEIEFGSHVTYLPSYCLEGCTNLSSIILSDKLTSIFQGAFYGCSSIEKIELPSGLKGIGMEAFYNCKNLKAIIFPETISELGTNSDGPTNSEKIFSGCNSLNEIICLYDKSVGKPIVNNYTKIFTPDSNKYGWGENIIALKTSEYEYSGQIPVLEFEPQYSSEMADLYNLNFKTSTSGTDLYVDAGSYDVECDVTLTSTSGDYSYKLPVNYTITPAPQTIDWRQDFENVFVGDQIELKAVSSSGLTVIYEVSDKNIATVNENVLTLISEGTVIVKASQSGNMNYLEATPIEALIHVCSNGCCEIKTISSTPDCIISVENHILTITGELTAPVAVYSQTGNLVYYGHGKEIYLKDEFYIAVINGSTFKILSKE